MRILALEREMEYLLSIGNKKIVWRVLWIFLLLFSFWLRIDGLFAVGLGSDEALFASYGRLIGSGRDIWLQTVSVDKPPLLFYLQGMLFPHFILGRAEWVARIPNLTSSLLLIPLLGRISYLLYRDREVAFLTAFCAVSSPYLIQFATVGYIDPLVLFFMMLSLLFILADQPQWSALVFGLGIWSKYQAFLFIPLFIILIWQRKWSWSEIRTYLLVVFLFLSLLLGWDLIGGRAAGLWEAQLDNYGGIRLIWSWELWKRLEEWGGLGWYFVGTKTGWIFILGGAIFFYWRRKEQLIDRILLLFMIGYGVVHWLLAVPIWDRYLLLIGGIFFLLIGRWMREVGRQRVGQIALLFFLVSFSGVGLSARKWGGPIGSERVVFQPLLPIVAYLAEVPEGAVLYDHWYSWHFRYYLQEEPIHLVWIPHTHYLIEDLTIFADGVQYLVVPKNQLGDKMVSELIEADFDLQLLVHAAVDGEAIDLYQIRK